MKQYEFVENKYNCMRRKLLNNSMKEKSFENEI
jgi:hypothetical protein